MYLTTKYENQNKGLPTNFKLDSKGKFLLVGGSDKVDDNMGMFLSFVGWYRFYTSDYVINIHKYINKTTSYLFRFKNILRLKMMSSAKKYVPFAKIYAIDIPIDYTNRKSTSLYIQFKYNLKEIEKFQTIKKIIV